MTKEVVIGKNVKPYFNSTCVWCGADVSENSKFYILNSDILETRIYICKDSTEGKEIAEWLSQEENRNNNSVQRKAIEIMLPRLTVDEFLSVIEKEKKSSAEQGYRNAQRDIRCVLGL